MDDKTIKQRVSALLSVKSIVTLLLTICLIAMIFYPGELSKELVALFSSSYGATITYFFTRKE